MKEHKDALVVVILYLAIAVMISFFVFVIYLIAKIEKEDINIVQYTKENIMISKVKKPKESYKVIATVYHAVPEQCNNDPEHTASMFKLDLNDPYKHRIIAVSRDLRSKFPYGVKVRVSGTGIYDGIYRVEDTMNKRFTNRIDILINKGMPLGKWNNVRIETI